MAKKFIPDGDSDFACMARIFANGLARDPARYEIEPEKSRQISAAVNDFREAMTANYNPRTRSMATRMHKDEMRARAEELIRDAANRIRPNKNISAVDKFKLGMKERAKRLKRTQCPQTPPVMRLVAGVHGGYSQQGHHVIDFLDAWGKQSKAKPAGAVRLELFVDLIPVGGKIPALPGQLNGGRKWYVQSYSSSPIKVEIPRSDVPSRAVYWGRWAGSTCDTGPFSQPLIAPMAGESWSGNFLPAPGSTELTAGGAMEIAGGHVDQTVIITSARRELPDCVERIDTVRAESRRALPEKAA